MRVTSAEDDAGPVRLLNACLADVDADLAPLERVQLYIQRAWLSGRGGDS